MAKKNVSAANVRELADLFGLLSGETRLKIVSRLADQEQNVGSLCRAMKVSQPTMSYHLNLLRFGGVLVNRRNGRQIIYSLNTKMLSSLMGQFNSMLRSKK